MASPVGRLPSGSGDRRAGPDQAGIVRSTADCGIIFRFEPDRRPTAVTEAEMHRTFVPDEATTPTCSTLFNPAKLHFDSRTSGIEFLGTFRTR